MQEVKELDYIGIILGLLRETPDNRQIDSEYPVFHPQLGEVMYSLELVTQTVSDNRGRHTKDCSYDALFISCTVDGKHLAATLRNPEKYVNMPAKLQEDIKRLDAWGEREGIQFP